MDLWLSLNPLEGNIQPIKAKCHKFQKSSNSKSPIYILAQMSSNAAGTTRDLSAVNDE